ncbi:redoxin family protein [Sinorhizobium fredii]|uniref:Thiol:disulfide interchange protein TlpA n=1 Tax=Sinorhizobium fredii (strain USDA 257) TaxID=1185652 RepID=I3X5X5_SINF2|nr:redoxin domain-containing protein [Sinorhizobium fredii]AFL51281.1 thiol:disulfide interchange protein TlpA [Sinorhizobium fredii USDA 257]
MTKMNTDTARTSAPSAMRRRSLLLLGVMGFAGFAGALFLRASVGPEPEGVPKGFVLNDTPKPIPDVLFTDGDGQPRTLADFRGKVVLLNVWATWCLPCRKEMPTLDRLQAALGGDRFQVVALSVDRLGAETVKTFYSEIGVRRLAAHVDASGRALSALAAVGLPTTILIDTDGRELGRLMGPAEWDAPDMVAFLKSIVEQKAGGVPTSGNKGNSQ